MIHVQLNAALTLILKVKSEILGSKENSHLLHKLVSHNKILDLSIRTKSANKLNEISLKSSIRKVCTLTGRSRGLIKKYKCSRIKFKFYAQEGLLAGVQKSS